MAYRRKAVSLSDFRSTEEAPDDGLLEVTFRNFQTVFAHYRGLCQLTREPVWVVHEEFCPSTLKELREPGMSYYEDVKGRPFNVPVDISATVGEQAKFSVYPSQYVMSTEAVASIKPCTYRDAHRDDLDVVFLQTISPH